MIEKVNPSHPDKVCDRVAGAIVDLAYAKEVDGVPYKEIVEEAREFIQSIGGFEKFAEWGLY